MPGLTDDQQHCSLGETSHLAEANCVLLRVCDDSGLPRHPGSGEYWCLRGGKPILQELLSLLYTAWNYPKNSVVSQRLAGGRFAFSESDRGTVARFKFALKKAGILVLHAGVILLLLGQLFTSLFQVESQMRLDQGETKNYSLSYYHDELAVIDTSAPDFDQVISIPDSQLYKGHKIGLPADS